MNPYPATNVATRKPAWICPLCNRPLVGVTATSYIDPDLDCPRPTRAARSPR